MISPASDSLSSASCCNCCANARIGSNWCLPMMTLDPLQEFACGLLSSLQAPEKEIPPQKPPEHLHLPRLIPAWLLDPQHSQVEKTGSQELLLTTVLLTEHPGLLEATFSSRSCDLEGLAPSLQLSPLLG